jgi:hypothetical protein
VAKLKTREEWLDAMTAALRPKFKAAGYPLPKRVRVSCGWPSEGGLRKSTVWGECWDATLSEGDHPEIFISPVLAEATAAVTLVHELVHAALPKKGHGAEFKRAMAPLGLIGKATATEAGAALKREIADLIKKIGPYPHSRLRPNARRTKKQSTRLLKVACPACGRARPLVRPLAKGDEQQRRCRARQ